MSVVIPTYNRCVAVCHMVETLLSDSQVDQVVVVVDGCRDGTIEILEERSHSDPRLRPLYVENRGEGLARQAGAELATGDVLLFLDDDVEPAIGLISGHLGHHQETSGLVVLGYMPTEIPRQRRPGWFPSVLYAREYEATTEQWELNPALMFLSFWAGNFSIRREDALRVGLAALHRFPYHEDQAFGMRCREAGLTPLFDRSLRVRHQHSRSFDAFVSDARRQGEGALMLHKHYGEGSFSFPDEEPFPAIVRRTIRAGADRRTGRFVQSLLRATVKVSGWLHLFVIETYAAMVLRSSVQREAILGMLSEESPSADGSLSSDQGDA